MNSLLSIIQDEFLALLYQCRPNGTKIKTTSKASHSRATSTMGKFGDALEEFLLSIPREKLEWFPDQNGTIYKNLNFRLDMQSVGSPHILLYTPEIV